MLSAEEEAIVVAFRRHTLLPLDDCLYALQPTIPHLTRSSLHRCLQRHGISRLPEVEGDKPGQEEVQGLPDRLLPHRHRRGAAPKRASSTCSSPSIAPPSSPSPNCMRQANTRSAVRLPARPDRGRALQDPHGAHRQRHPVHHAPRNRIRHRSPCCAVHAFDRVCRENGIEHRLTKPNHPWTNGQVERMNRTLKDATVRRYHYDTHDQLRTHLADFLAAYNYARRLKTLRGLTPTSTSARSGQRAPTLQTRPVHQMPGLNT